MNRREFMKKAGQTVALTALAGQTEFLLSGCQSQSNQRPAITKPDFEVPTDSRSPKVVLARNEDNATALRIALDGIGGTGRFVKRGERVLIKPNVSWVRTPAQAVNTNPLL